MSVKTILMFFISGFMVLVTVIGGLGLIVFQGDVANLYASVSYDTVQGEVTDYDIFDDYINITFNNNQSFDIVYQENMDFTVNSQLIVKLKRYDYDGVFLSSDDYWRVDSITKVPSKEE